MGWLTISSDEVYLGFNINKGLRDKYRAYKQNGSSLRIQSQTTLKTERPLAR